MVKPKQRKTRLDKAEQPSEFIGFGAFAAAKPAGDGDDDTDADQSQQPQQRGSSRNRNTQFTWTPVYTAPKSSSGVDDHGSLSLLFARMAQKRDPVTVTKAVLDLQQQCLRDAAIPKPARAQALRHYAWLYQSRLHYENAATVRAAALQTWKAAATELPRAVAGIAGQHPSLLGLWLCARAGDPASEVRAAAAALVDACPSSGSDGNWPWQEGLIEHANRVLSCGRASALQNELYPTKKQQRSTTSSKGSKQTSSDAAPIDPKKEERNRDAMEERYERVIGSCLEALTRWMQEHDGSWKNADDTSATTAKLWWKTITSPKASLRRKTYQLLAAVAMKAPHLILPSSTSITKSMNLVTVLPQAVSSEKEAANVPVLLETVLTVLVLIQKQQCSTSNDTPTEEGYDRYALPTALTPPLVKLLRKACYGAAVEAWGPVLLPLTAHLPRQHQLQLHVLQAAQQGCELVLAPADQWKLQGCIAESAAFLLRKTTAKMSTTMNRSDGDDNNNDSDDGNDDDNDPRALAQVWLSVWHCALALNGSNANSSRKPASKSSTAREVLVRDLAQQLVQFSSSSSNCDFATIADWFWDDGLTLDSASSIDGALLVQLLQELIQQRRRSLESNPERQQAQEATQMRLLPKLRDRFRQTLSPHQESSSAVPSVTDYQLLDAILAYGGPVAVLVLEQSEDDFDNAVSSSSLEKFVMNDLLRWAVIHTSTLSSAHEDDALRLAMVRHAFGLLSRCLAAFPSEQTGGVWEVFLREILTAKCDLGYLVAGLISLVQRAVDYENMDWLRCGTLNEFAVEVGRGSKDELAAYIPTSSYHADEEESLETSSSADHVYEKKLHFFGTCLGLESVNAPCLVDSHVLSKWVESATLASDAKPDTASTNALLEALLQTLQKKRRLVSDDQADRLLLKSWRCVESFFEVYGIEILRSDADLCTRFVDATSCESRVDLARLSNEDSCLALCAESWATKAWRVLKIGKAEPSPMIGLEDRNAWKQSPSVLFKVSMSLLGKFESKTDRINLVKSWSKSDPTTMILDILVSLSEASDDVLLAAKSKARSDLCAEFLASIGGSDLEESVISTWVRALVSRLSASLEEPERKKQAIRNGEVAVLSQLLSLIFEPVSPSRSDVLEAESVAEGDRLWYISDPKTPAEREEVDVVKVHYDVQAGYFFTIQVTRDDESQERQTVLDRLRKYESPRGASGVIPSDCLSGDELSRRSTILELLLKDLVLPYSSHFLKSPWMGELVSVCIGQVGVGKDRGLGSAHYDIYRFISSAEEAVRASIQNGSLSSGRDGLWSLSLAFGFGLSVPTTVWTMKQFPVNPIPLYSLLLNQYEIETDIKAETDCAVLAWLIVSIESALEYREKWGKVLTQALMLLFDRVSNILESESNEDFSGPALIACRALQAGLEVRNQRKFQHMQTDEEDANKLVKAMQASFDILVQRFAMDWNGGGNRKDDGISASTYVARWSTFSPFPQLVASSHARGLMAESCLKNVDVLSKLLYVSSKRYYSLLLLDKLAARGKALQAVDNVSLPDGTSRRLKSWSKGFEEEEAAEIEEDIYIVAEWMPPAMMVDVESWVDDTHDFDENAIVGRFLTWLVLLRFVDSATPKDFRNRPAFVSYFCRCGAVSSVLNLALLYNETVNDRKRKVAPSLLDMETLLNDESHLDVQQLSSLVLFRTIEVLPSLSRRWWEEDCSNVYSDAVQSFVEKYVSPEILKREMGRMKTVASFGPMAVSASAVSREVIASYVQDDFSLRVSISLPAAFPFRNAEVDCSKTLGVPQNRWKRWSLQINLMLNNQGGTIPDALLLWKQNVEKEFEGVEPCPICYSVLHAKTHKLPALECKTCHNRFHFDCLTEWLRSSGKSQCVLCQQPWQGTRVA